jgi:succinate-acetate transporter protein
MTGQVFLRPVANPLPLGFLALAGATLLVSGLQLEWLKPTEGAQVGLILIAFVFPLQLVVSVFGFLARDVVAGTGMGILAGTWLSVGLIRLTGEPGSTSDLAMALEDALGRAVLPIGRHGPVDAEPGVRPQL